MIDGVNTPAGIDRVLLIGVAFGGFRMENDEDLLGAPFAVFFERCMVFGEERSLSQSKDAGAV